jgi:hypothetical protein
LSEQWGYGLVVVQGDDYVAFNPFSKQHILGQRPRGGLRLHWGTYGVDVSLYRSGPYFRADYSPQWAPSPFLFCVTTQQAHNQPENSSVPRVFYSLTGEATLRTFGTRWDSQEFVLQQGEALYLPQDTCYRISGDKFSLVSVSPHKED